MIRTCTFKKKKKKKKKNKKQKEKKKKKKMHNDMIVYGILFHWALMSPFEVYLLGIFFIVGSCEVFI